MVLVGWPTFGSGYSNLNVISLTLLQTEERKLTLHNGRKVEKMQAATCDNSKSIH